MVDGEPNVSMDAAKQAAGFRPDQECFPAPLRHEVDAQGHLLGELSEPIAADFRLADGTQGWTSPEAYRQELKRSGRFSSDAAARAVEAYRQRSELMKLKIIAGILGVDLASLTRRDAAYQLQLAQRRARILRRWLTAVGVLALFAIAGGLLAYQKEREAEHQRDRTEQANLHLLTNTSAAHLREKDTRMAQGVILEVLRRAAPANPIEQAMTVAFQEARAADFQLTGMAIDGGAREAAYSPTGKTLVTAANDGTAAIWDVATGSRLIILRGHGGAVRSAAYSPDGERIVTASADGTARVWQAGSGALLGVLSGHLGPVNTASFSPDGLSIATASEDKTARLWRAADLGPRLILAGHDEAIESAAFSPDGKHVVTASRDKTARIWNSLTGEVEHSLSGHHEFVHSAAYSPAGDSDVTASQDNTAKVWDTQSGAALATFSGHLRSVNWAAYSPDGRRIVTASLDKTVRVWDAETGAQLRVLAGHLDSVASAVYSPDGSRILTASADGFRTHLVYSAAQSVACTARREGYRHVGRLCAVGF